MLLKAEDRAVGACAAWPAPVGTPAKPARPASTHLQALILPARHLVAQGSRPAALRFQFTLPLRRRRLGRRQRRCGRLRLALLGGQLALQQGALLRLQLLRWHGRPAAPRRGALLLLLLAAARAAGHRACGRGLALLRALLGLLLRRFQARLQNGSRSGPGVLTGGDR